MLVSCCRCHSPIFPESLIRARDPGRAMAGQTLHWSLSSSCSFHTQNPGANAPRWRPHPASKHGGDSFLPSSQPSPVPESTKGHSSLGSWDPCHRPLCTVHRLPPAAQLPSSSPVRAKGTDLQKRLPGQDCAMCHLRRSSEMKQACQSAPRRVPVSLGAEGQGHSLLQHSADVLIKR